MSGCLLRCPEENLPLIIYYTDNLLSGILFTNIVIDIREQAEQPLLINSLFISDIEI